MFGFWKRTRTVDTRLVLDHIEEAVYHELKSCGFRKYGRTLHRFVAGDISQVINFQVGQSYRGENHLLYVNVGIRIPECEERSFSPEQVQKKYYHEYECNMRSRLGEIEGKKVSCYNLRKSADRMIEDILYQIRTVVMPVFDTLISRDAILLHRREYPLFDTMNHHLILLEEAMIYGRRGETDKAAEWFNRYYHQVPETNRNHLEYLNRLAQKLDITIELQK